MKDNTISLQPRTIKSYVCRSRMTALQRYSLENYGPLYIVQLPNLLLDLKQLFQRQLPVILEIGFGMGHSLIKLARSNPDYNFLGIEVHRPGVGTLLNEIHLAGLTNLKVIVQDALLVLRDYLPDDSLAGVLLYFPDPWPKKRHHKRRIVQAPFIELINKKLKADGYLHMATDIEHYAKHMAEVVISHGGFHNYQGQENLPANLQRTKTKFELRGETLGHVITDLVFYKKVL